MKKVLVCVVLSLLCMVNTKFASAIVINIVPDSLAVQAGEAFTMDVVVSGLSAANEIVSAYDLNIAYDTSILNATGVSFGSFLDDLTYPSIQDSILINPGTINFAELSFLSDSELVLQQSDSFTLATLSFDAIMAGVSPVTFVADQVYGIDVKGTYAKILTMDAVNAMVTVNPAISVPEPNTLALMLIALLGLPLRKFYHSRIAD